MSNYVDTSTKTQMAQIMVQYGRPSCSSWTESVRLSFGRTVMWNGNLREFYWKTIAKKFQIENVYSLTEKKDYCYLCLWTIKTGRKETKHWSDLENSHERRWFGRTNIIPRPCLFGLHSKRMSDQQRYCGQLHGCVWIQHVIWRYRKITLFREIWSEHFLMVLWKRKVMQRNAWKDIANLRTKQLNNKTQLQRHALTTTNSRKKKWDHKIYFIERKATWRIYKVPVRLTRKQTTSRPDNMWKHMCDAPKKKAKKRWAIEKPKLDNARQLRGIFFIAQDDEESRHTMKNCRRKSEIPMPAAMPCKAPINSCGETRRSIGKRKTKYVCIVCCCRRMYVTQIGRSCTQTSRISHHCKRGEFIESLQSCAPNHSDASSIKITGCKSSSGKRMGKLEKVPAWQLTKVRNKKEVIEEARNEGRKVHFAS